MFVSISAARACRLLGAIGGWSCGFGQRRSFEEPRAALLDMPLASRRVQALARRSNDGHSSRPARRVVAHCMPGDVVTAQRLDVGKTACSQASTKPHTTLNL